MIDNYLDWVKGQRKYCVKMAVLYGRREREIADAWSKGFFRGLSMSYDFSGQDLKRLQKDIEASLKESYGHYPEDAGFTILDKFYK